MCGFNGLFGLETIDSPHEIISKMCQTMAHRGPDNQGDYVDDMVALGHRRLSIIDLSPAGNQPFHSKNGRWVIVFNGELYNYLELRAELGEENFETKTDTEVVLEAFENWGRPALQKFNGMFAFALWDKRDKKLLLVRDRLGIKPCYYHQNDSGIVFGSEIRSLLSSGIIPKKLNTEALTDYFRYQTVHAPETLVKDVKMLEAGHFMEITDNEVIKAPYWDITKQFDVTISEQSKEKVQKRIREKLQDSVSLRMRADVPFGAFLSGGIDSSAIVALMSQVSDQAVKTFNVSFDEREFSEARFADMIAKKYNTDHTEIRLRANDFLDLLPEALKAMDHPSGDGPNTYVVSKVTREAGVTMALSGLGGDELFAGYDIFKRSHSLLEKKWLMSFPKALRNVGTGILKVARPGVSSDKIAAVLDQDYLDLEHSYPVSRMSLLDHQIKKLLTRESLSPNAVKRIVREGVGFGEDGFHLPFLSKVSYAEMNTYMQNVLLRDTDQMSMAHALEVRVPFLDHELVELVMGVSDRYKYPYTPKKLLIDSLGDLLPDEVVNRPKMGFTFPWEMWMKNELMDFCTTRLFKLAERPEFHASEFHHLWSAFVKGDQRITWSRIWPLVVLSDWIDQLGIE